MDVAIGGYLSAFQLSKMPHKLTYLEREKLPSQISIEKKWKSTFQETLELIWVALRMISRNDDETANADFTIEPN